MTSQILVVDDEPDIEALVVQKYRREIRSGALAFSFAGDGVEALAVLANRPDIDVVISDINMPRMDGLTLLTHLAALDHPPASMIVSAYGDMSNIRTAMNRGAFDFVTKPIDFVDFETTLQKTLRHVEVRRAEQGRTQAAERAQAALARYFSPRLAGRLAQGDATAALEGRSREVSAMFTDIAGFTTLAESLEISVLTTLLNDYLSAMIDVVFAHEGTIAKIIGDGLYVLFGAPDDQPDHPARAIACARALDAVAQTQRQRWQAQGVALGITRIGLHTGTAVVGNFGGGRFFDYAAYGDTINIAARLETANKQLGTRVCISETVVARVPGAEVRPIGDLRLRGRNQMLRAYAPVDPGPEAALAAETYRAAFALTEAGDAAALPAFATLVGQLPDDALANFHLRRLLNGERSTRIELA
ncbi:MAG: response regulator [Alphaproteobacteria bacterium]|nr:response regulator [Alphaproteobacteria bacterium]